MFRKQFFALGVENEIIIDHASEKVIDLMISETNLVEQRYSRFLPESLVSKINQTAGKDAVVVDSETAALIDYADLCYKESGGLFDITSGVLRKIWDFKKKIIPTEAQLNEILPLVGWDKVKWRNPEIFLPQIGMEIDLGGIGKEYCVDRLIAIAEREGVKNCLINLGGDLRAIGDQEFAVGIADPRKNGEVMRSLPLKNAALATSGDYQRFFELNGTRYCHILNPKNGSPVKKTFQSVTVIAPLCLVAGTATTISMLLGEIEGLRYLKKLKVPYLVVASNGEVETNGRMFSF